MTFDWECRRYVDYIRMDGRGQRVNDPGGDWALNPISDHRIPLRQPNWAAFTLKVQHAVKTAMKADELVDFSDCQERPIDIGLSA